MAGLKLLANPTFQAEVRIPVPEGEAVLTMTFKHRTKSSLPAFFEKLKALTDLEVIKEVASGWDADGEFDDENISTLLDQYHMAGYTITQRYIEALGQFKKGN